MGRSRTKHKQGPDHPWDRLLVSSLIHCGKATYHTFNTAATSTPSSQCVTPQHQLPAASRPRKVP